MAEIIKGLISVIVPVYKVEEYLEKCVDGILAQTYTDLEVILVDDGSPDRCGEICDNYAARDSRVTVIHQENGGLSAARNAALLIAKGEFVAFVDSDDFIDNDMYRTLYDRARQTGSDVVECNLHHTFPNYEDTETVEKYYDKKTLLCFGRCVVWNKIYRSELLRRAGASFPLGLYYEDIEFYAKLIPHIKGYEYVDIAPYHYLQRTNSINNFSTVRTREIFTILRNITDYYKANGFYEEYHEALEFFYTRILLCSSFSRMCNIPDGEIRSNALAANWRLLVETYPNWRKNAILKAQRTKHGIFMRSVNSVTYKIYSVVFPAAYSLKRKIAVRKR